MTAFSKELARLKRQAVSFVSDLEQLEAIATETVPIDASDKKDIITIEELAEVLSVHHNTVRRYINLGLLEPYRIGKKMYFLRNELPAILEAATKAREEMNTTNEKL